MCSPAASTAVSRRRAVSTCLVALAFFTTGPVACQSSNGVHLRHILLHPEKANRDEYIHQGSQDEAVPVQTVVPLLHGPPCSSQWDLGHGQSNEPQDVKAITMKQQQTGVHLSKYFHSVNLNQGPTLQNAESLPDQSREQQGFISVSKQHGPAIIARMLLLGSSESSPVAAVSNSNTNARRLHQSAVHSLSVWDEHKAEILGGAVCGGVFLIALVIFISLHIREKMAYRIELRRLELTVSMPVAKWAGMTWHINNLHSSWMLLLSSVFNMPSVWQRRCCSHHYASSLNNQIHGVKLLCYQLQCTSA